MNDRERRNLKNNLGAFVVLPIVAYAIVRLILHLLW